MADRQRSPSRVWASPPRLEEAPSRCWRACCLGVRRSARWRGSGRIGAGSRSPLSCPRNRCSRPSSPPSSMTPAGRPASDPDSRAEAAFLLALHADPQAARDPAAGSVNGSSAADVAERSGLRQPARVYVTACVAASTAIADAAAMIVLGPGRHGRGRRGLPGRRRQLRACSTAAGRSPVTARCARSAPAGRDMLLGDGVAAVVLEIAAVRPAPRRAGAGAAGRLGPGGRRVPRLPAAARMAAGLPGRSPRLCAAAGPTSPTSAT